MSNSKFHNRYTDEELINLLKDFYIKNNKIPLVEDFKMPDASTFSRRFGSWKNALAIAGLVKSKDKSTDYTNEELIEYLLKYYKENNKVPTNRDMKKYKGYPSSGTYINHFGSFKEALIIANLYNLRVDKYQFDRVEYSKEELLNILELFIKLLGKFPTNEEVDNNPNMPTCNPYNKHFGGLYGAFEELGYNIKEYRDKEKENLENDMILKLKKLADLIGETPTSRDIEKYCKQDLVYGTTTYINHFGSVKNATRIAGLKINAPNRITSKKDKEKPGKEKSNENLINELKILAFNLDRTPIRMELKLYDNMASGSLYNRRFGSWNEALLQAGLEPNTKVIITKNGTKCYSYYEYKMACILEKLKILFLKDTPYRKIIFTYNGYKRFDYIINIDNKQYFIEVFGITGSEHYEQGKQEKIKLCRDNNIPLISFYPDDFWNYNNNEKMINYLYNQINSLEPDTPSGVFSFLFT